jgi:hypothetical protein
MPKKISQLTATTTVQNTDLFEISMDDGLGGFASRKITGANMRTQLGGLTVGTTAIASGTVGRVLFQGSSNILQQDGELFWNNTTKNLGVGATPATTVKLDVRAQGALSTDIGFRVRNSADTANLFDVQGNGHANVRTRIYNTSGTGIYAIRTTGNGSYMEFNNSSGTPGVTIKGGTTDSLVFADQRDIGFGTTTGTKIGYATNQKLSFWNKTPIIQPTTGVAAAAFVANAGTAVNDASTFGGYTIRQVVQALQNIGLLA